MTCSKFIQRTVLVCATLVVLCILLASVSILLSYHSDHLAILAALLAAACAFAARRGVQKMDSAGSEMATHQPDNLVPAGSRPDSSISTALASSMWSRLRKLHSTLDSGTLLVVIFALIFAGFVSIAAAAVVADKGGIVAWLLSFATVGVGATIAAVTGAASMVVRPRSLRAMVARVAFAAAIGAAGGRCVGAVGCAVLFEAVATFVGVAIASAASAVVAAGGVVALTLASTDMRTMITTVLEAQDMETC